MSATNDTYRTSVATGESNKVSSLASAEMARQAKVNSAKADVGYIEGFPTGYATFAAAVAAANTAKLKAVQDAEMAKQAAVETAKNVARDAGEKLTQ
jgi:hypothetical protein